MRSKINEVEMKPSVVVSSFIKPTSINDYVIEKLEVDLRHVNYGLDHEKGYRSKARSHFSLKEIACFFESLNGMELEPEVDENWEYYFVEKIFFTKKKFRMVFCLNQIEPNVCGIITLYEVKR